MGITDVVADNDLIPDQRAERGNYVGCVAGALPFAEYERVCSAAGFKDITIISTHETMPGSTRRSSRRQSAPAPKRPRRRHLGPASCLSFQSLLLSRREGWADRLDAGRWQSSSAPRCS